MPLFGTGIIMENPSASPIPFPVAWGTTNLGLSSFAGTSPFYAQPPYGTAVDVADCYFQIPNTQTLGVASYVIPPGLGYLACSASTGGTLQLFYAASSGAAGTWTTILTLAAGTMTMYISDGVNVRVNATTSCSFILFPIRA